ncbi:MAG: hypothetical protein CMO80_07665 [Verrucomicrobiales bacterium]|nr:hypothetical protein [Verrucomicrobiales bacterium]
MNQLNTLCLAGLSAMLAGCVGVRYEPFETTGDAVQDGIRLAARAPQKDRVMWNYRTAAVALRSARFEDAKRLLDDCIGTIEGIYGPDKMAKSARTYVGKESSKTFIGEPYERVMAYFYRGILYWMDGEPDNARACFRSAQVHDADAEDNSYASDYVLLDYLDGYASAKLSTDGSDALKRARANTAQGPLPDYDKSANVLVFVEYGNGPIKVAAGQYRQKLRFREGHSPNQSAAISIASKTAQAEPLDDLYYQATTRGARVIDHILAGQAKFRRSTDKVGNAAIITGAILANQQGRKSSADEIGAGLLLFGLASKLISSATNPRADTRAWDNLPRYLSFAAFRVPPGEHELTAEFKDGAGQIRRKKTLSISLPAASKDVVVFVSDKMN